MHRLNRLTRALASVCKKSPLTEKWLIAPSRRVGGQWTETVAARGTPVVNVRVLTLKGLAVHLAGSLIANRKLKIFPRLAGPILVSRLWSESGASEVGAYLSVLESSPGAAESLFRTLNDLRLAGIDENALDPTLFEVDAKGRELGELLAAWTAWLVETGHVDHAGVLRLARQALNERQPPANPMLLIPTDIEPAVLEQEMIDAFRPGAVRLLPVDEPGALGEKTSIFTAVGEINEVRHVFRSCLEKGHRLDEVELIHTDTETYLRLIFDTLAGVAKDAAGLEMEMPATFAEGVPALWLRPGRALAAWVSWIRNGFIQKNVKEMIHAGLLAVKSTGPRTVGFSNLAGLFSSLPIGFGRDRYIDAIRREKRAEAEAFAREGGEDTGNALELELLETLLNELVGTAPESAAPPEDVLENALRFMTRCARTANRFDRNAQKELVREITNTLEFIEVGGAGSLDAWDWLERLTGRVRVEGSGPRPGCIHVANIGAAGHSGRSVHFIIGLDDTRFPGGGSQDPLLLDNERKRLSGGLPTAENRLAARAGEFERLLARLRGTVVLGYSRRDLVDDRDLFPGAPILSTFRTLSGCPEGDQGDLDRWIGRAATFVPARSEQAFEEGEWWLWRLCGGDAVEDAHALIRACYPDLDQGLCATAERESGRFTEWDGRVPLAGTRHDPFGENGPVLSASALETIGACPRSYFFKYVLGISPPDVIGFDITRWLDPMAYGSLLHDVFYRFVRDLLEKDGWPPSFERDWPAMNAIVSERIRFYRGLHPVCSESAFQAQVREIEKGARNFLRNEEIESIDRRPRFLEASIGMRSFESGTGIDSVEPVQIDLAAGRTIRARGRIDRIDELRTAGEPHAAPGRTFELWDYKSGSAWKYTQGEVFDAGRVVQHALYLSLAGARLREAVASEAAIERSGYFFPGVRGQGERLIWTARELSGWRPVVDALCRIVRDGAFLHTADPSRCSFCEYLPACSESPQAVDLKLSEDSENALGPVAELQEYD